MIILQLLQRLHILCNLQAVPLTEAGPSLIDDGHWHCVQIVHSAGKRPFGTSQLQIYVDGTKKIECALKYPVSNGDTWAYCQIGNNIYMNKQYFPNSHASSQQCIFFYFGGFKITLTVQKIYIVWLLGR